MNVQVIFNTETHRYFNAEGKEFPSVTRIMAKGRLINYDFLSEDDRDFFFDRGTKIHWCLQLYDEGAAKINRMKNEMRGYARAWKEWKKQTGFVVSGIEVPFISPFGYAGTRDRDGHFKSNPDIPVVLDIKSGTHINDAVKYQLAAYAAGRFPDDRVMQARCRRICFQPLPDGKWNVKEYYAPQFPTDFAKFYEALRRYKQEGM